MAEIISVAEITENYSSKLVSELGERLFWLVSNNIESLESRGLGGTVARLGHSVEQSAESILRGRFLGYTDRFVIVSDSGDAAGIMTGLRCGDRSGPEEYNVRRLRLPLPPGIAHVIPIVRENYDYGYEIKGWTHDNDVELLAIGYARMMQLWKTRSGANHEGASSVGRAHGVAFTGEKLSEHGSVDDRLHEAITRAGLDYNIHVWLDDREISRRLFVQEEGSRVPVINRDAWHMPPRSILYMPSTMHGLAVREDALISGKLG